MTIDEAIENLKHDYEIDMYIRDIAPQLAEWLEELKALKEKEEKFDRNMKFFGKIQWESCKAGYTKAVDDFADRLSKYLDVENATKYGNENAEQQIKSYDTLMKYEIAWAIDDVAEQLKEGGVDG